MNIPSGTVTFLFTDIEGSTKLSQDFPETIQSALERHHAIMKTAIESNNGFVFEIIGDSFCSAFENAKDAVRAAVDAQLNLNKENWKDAEIKIRIGVHSGNAEWNGKRYMGYITLARATRVMSSGHGHQIIISNSTYELIKNEFYSVKEKDISFRDLGERRMKDVIQPIRLFQILCPGLIEDFPPLKTLDARPNNLSVQLTGFIGREKEIADIKKILSGVRLLTFLGPGGTGKTRLALQVGADIIDDFANGVWIVELASLNDPFLLPQTIAESLGLKENPGVPIEKTLIDYLIDKEILIILDNCEHLIDASSQLAERLLQNSPGLKIIATSREALRCKGEFTHMVSSLAHPDPKELITAERLSQYEAARLFIERAMAVNPKFRVTNENAPALAGICSQLDGIPLAIELAAARINVLSLDKIYLRLDGRFKLLTGGKRTALPRQQTLKAMIDWSYDLLTEKEKSLFRRLSVFSGGWSLEAVEEICSDNNMDSYETMDTNSNLLDKSLISSSEINGATRFFMLETIKQYSKEISDSNKETNQKHLYYFKKLSDHEQMILNGMPQIEWIKLIETEQDNMRAAIRWGSENEPEEAFPMVYNISEYWSIKGNFIEGLQICVNILNTNLPVDVILRAGILYTAALMLVNLGNISEAEKYVNESLSVFRNFNNKKGIARCLNMLGVISSLNIETQNESLEFYNEAISIFRELDIKSETAITLYNMSCLVTRKGNDDLAMDYKKEALNIFKELNNTHQVIMMTTNLGIFEFKRNNFETARTYTEESLSNSKQMGDKYLISINLINLGCIYSGLQQHEKAFGLIEESLVILRECGYKSSIVAALMYMGEVTSCLGEEDKAINFHKESIQTGSDAGIDYFLANNFYRLGISYYNLKDYESSIRYFIFLKTITDNHINPIGSERMNIAEEYKNKLKEILGNEKYESLLNETSQLSKDDSLKFALDSK
ncbi:MAG: adenylate/guanylate cyclase domain-containing protein [bacterium]